MHRHSQHPSPPPKCRGDAPGIPRMDGKKTGAAARPLAPKSWLKGSARHGPWGLPQSGHPRSHTSSLMTPLCPFPLAWVIALTIANASAVPGLACAPPQPPPKPQRGKGKARQKHTQEPLLCPKPHHNTLLWHGYPTGRRGQAGVGPPGPKAGPSPEGKGNIFRMALALRCF